MPNATLYHIASLTPSSLDGTPIQLVTIDEYVWVDLSYLKYLRSEEGYTSLLAIVGVQTHQFQRALDLAAYALHNGIKHTIIGGPHAMTCDTKLFQGRGVSFALCEAEIVWHSVLEDVLQGELKPIYGSGERWAKNLDGFVVRPPRLEDLNRYWAPMWGLYPVRGCPYNCNFCSVIKISGRQIRSPAVENTLKSLRLADRKGIETIMFVSDNFNKYPDVEVLLRAMIAERFKLRFFCQCDAKVANQPELVELLAEAGCFEMFVGVESFDRNVLKSARKYHNYPKLYESIVQKCRQVGIRPHFSNIIGFPEQDSADIWRHLHQLVEVGPTVASFYILTPIPGTDQYDTFREKDLIKDVNLDRFDASSLVWRHPKVSDDEMESLLFTCYSKFYASVLRKGNLSDEDKRIAIFSRFMAGQRRHPMAGGIDSVRLDHQISYASLRLGRYGVERAPLPDSLHLTNEHEAAYAYN